MKVLTVVCVNMYIGIWWHRQLYVLICTLVSGGMHSCMCYYVHWYLVIWTVVCIICTLVSGGIECCMC